MEHQRTTYAIGELAALAGATPRTVRYYVAQGLLPAPSGAGAGAHYTDDHLARLRLIRRLQHQHQPLSEIRQRLGSLGERDILELLAGEEPVASPANTALEYLRGILAPERPPVVGPPPAAAPTASAPAAASRSPGPLPALFRRAAPAMPLRAAEASPAYLSANETASVAAAPDVPEAEQRSQWDRIALTPNIEIHVRRPLGRLENRRVERLITIARQVLREEQP